MFKRKYQITLFTIIAFLFTSTTSSKIHALTNYEMSIGAYELIAEDDEYNLNDTDRYILTYEGDKLISMNDKHLKKTFTINHTTTTSEEDYQQFTEYKKLIREENMRLNRYVMLAAFITAIILSAAFIYDRSNSQFKL